MRNRGPATKMRLLATFTLVLVAACSTFGTALAQQSSSHSPSTRAGTRTSEFENPRVRDGERSVSIARQHSHAIAVDENVLENEAAALALDNHTVERHIDENDENVNSNTHAPTFDRSAAAPADEGMLSPAAGAIIPYTAANIGKVIPAVVGRTFLLISFGTRGDVQPYIGLCTILQRRGHRCRIATHTDYRPWIESYNITFRPLGGSGKMIREFMASLTNNGFASPRNMLAARKMARFLYAVYVDAYAAARREDGQCDVDVVLGVNWVHIGQHVAEKCKLPYIEVQAFPNTKTGDADLYFFENRLTWLHRLLPSSWSRKLSRFTYKLADWTVATVGTRHLVNDFRRKHLGLPRLSASAFRRRLRSVPIVYGISPHVLPKPRDWNDRVHLVGYWSLPPKPTVPRLPSVARTSLVRSPSTINPAAIDSQLPADLLSFLYSSTDKQLAALPVVYIGFGSMAGPRVHKIVQKVLTQTVLAHRVVSRLKQQSLYRVVFSYYDVVEDKNEGGASGEPTSISAKEKRKRKREKKRAEFKYDPRYVYHLKTNVPHDELFSRMDVIVHHGGAGTVATTVTSGVPSVIRPFIGDQYGWCERMVKLGVGRCSTTPFMRRTSHKVVHDIRHILRNLSEYQRRAKDLQRAVKSEDVARATIHAVETELARLEADGNNFPGLNIRV